MPMMAPEQPTCIEALTTFMDLATIFQSIIVRLQMLLEDEVSVCNQQQGDIDWFELTHETMLFRERTRAASEMATEPCNAVWRAPLLSSSLSVRCRDVLASRRDGRRRFLESVAA